MRMCMFSRRVDGGRHRIRAPVAASPPAAPAAPRLCGRWTDGPQLVFGALLESCFDDVGATEAEAERLRLFRSNMHLQPSNAAVPGLTAPTDLDADDEDM